MHLDNQRLIVQSDGDAGDSLHRAGSWALVEKIRQELNVGSSLFDQPERPRPWREAQPLYEVKPGIYVRHPDKSKWYSNPDTTSRDQLVPAIIALGVHKMRAELWRVEKKILLRGLFAQNIYRNWEPVENQKKKIPDTFLFCIGLLIRAWGRWAIPLYPVLIVLDFVDMIGQMIELIPIRVTDEWKVRRKDSTDADDMNGINKHLQALFVLPTPFSWASRKLYSKYRMATMGTIELKEPNRIMGALVWYNRPAGNGNPEMAEIYRPLIERYFS